MTYTSRCHLLRVNTSREQLILKREEESSSSIDAIITINIKEDLGDLRMGGTAFCVSNFQVMTAPKILIIVRRTAWGHPCSQHSTSK